MIEQDLSTYSTIELNLLIESLSKKDKYYYKKLNIQQQLVIDKHQQKVWDDSIDNIIKIMKEGKYEHM